MLHSAFCFSIFHSRHYNQPAKLVTYETFRERYGVEPGGENVNMLTEWVSAHRVGQNITITRDILQFYQHLGHNLYVFSLGHPFGIEIRPRRSRNSSHVGKWRRNQFMEYFPRT